MAEGWARALKSDVLEAYSAGIEARGLDRRAVTVMAEEGIDISAHRSKHPSEITGIEFDCVVTLCDDANESCPTFPGSALTVHRGFDDPPRLARDAASESEVLGHYRRVRDEIKAFVAALPDVLTKNEGE